MSIYSAVFPTSFLLRMIFRYKLDLINLSAYFLHISTLWLAFILQQEVKERFVEGNRYHQSS